MIDEALRALRGGRQLVEQFLAGHAERNVVGDGGAEASRGLRVEPHLVEHQQARAELEAFLEIVGDHENVHLVAFPQLQDQLVHVGRQAGIEQNSTNNSTSPAPPLPTRLV